MTSQLDLCKRSNVVQKRAFLNLPDSICSIADPIHLTGSPPGGLFSGFGVSNNNFNPSNSNSVGVITYYGEDVCPYSISKHIFVENYQAKANIGNSNELYYPNTIANLLATPEGGVFSGIGVSGNIFNAEGLPSGTYFVKYQGNGLCGPFTTGIAIKYFGDSLAFILPNLDNKLNAIFYPNPINNQLTVEIVSGQISEQTEFDLFDVNGLLVFSIAWDGTETSKTIMLPELFHGVYFAKLRKGDETFFSKLVKLDSK